MTGRIPLISTLDSPLGFVLNPKIRRSCRSGSNWARKPRHHDSDLVIFSEEPLSGPGWVEYEVDSSDRLISELASVLSDVIPKSLVAAGLKGSAMNGSDAKSERATTEQRPKLYKIVLHLGPDVNPEEINLSRKDRCLTVEVKHERHSEDGTTRLYQEFSKKITIPEDVEVEKLKSSFNSGMLVLEAPFVEPEPAKTVEAPKVIPIPITIEDSEKTATSGSD